MPKISVSIPHFNYGLFIGECVDSILRQTFSDFELIIVDDCSTDSRSKKEVERQLVKDPRIRCIFNEYNVNCAASRNIGIQNSSGEYVVSFDADNTMLPEFLEEHLKASATHTLVSCQYQGFGNRSFIDRKRTHFGLKELLRENIIDCCAMFPKKVWEEVGGFKPELKALYDDWEFWINLAKHGHEVFFIDKVLFNYRQHPRRSSIINTQQHTDHVNIIKKYHPEFEVV